MVFRLYTWYRAMAPAILTQRPRILFLDAYDSFSNNIVAIVEQNIDAHVVKIFIDDPNLTQVKDDGQHSAFTDYLKSFDGVIAGPGPGWAKCEKDVGLMKELWSLQEEQLVPVFGICLGFQSMCLAFGADIERLEEPKHGIITTVLHKGQSIFRGVERLLATQYHSLHVKLDHPIQSKRAVRYPAQLWNPLKLALNSSRWHGISIVSATVLCSWVSSIYKSHSGASSFTRSQFAQMMKENVSSRTGGKMPRLGTAGGYFVMFPKTHSCQIRHLPP